MSLQTSRIAVLASTLAAVGAIFLATTSALASVTPPTEETCSETSSPTGELLGPLSLEKPVSGSISIKKLGQNIALTNGLFAGEVVLCAREGLQVEGTITKGKITFPPFLAPLKFRAPPRSTELGITILQFGEGEGTITRPAGNEEEEPITVNLNVQAGANITFTNVDVRTKRKPVQCTTVEPVKLPLVKHLSLLELLLGTTITGTATLPKITCGGPGGPATGNLLTREMSGPDNPFSITFESLE
jgi:hypothetical protein